MLDLQGGLRPHAFCLPILKREEHRQAVLAAATSGNPKFFLGTDSAPHARGDKVCSPQLFPARFLTLLPQSPQENPIDVLKLGRHLQWKVRPWLIAGSCTLRLSKNSREEGSALP